MAAKKDTSLDNLLFLDGQTFFIDAEGKFSVKFVIKRVPVTAQRPHGLNYSLTLHDEKGQRLLGFDNAHPVRSTSGPAGKRNTSHDHMHRLKSVRQYDYQDAAQLLADFWREVDRVLKEKGVTP